jgi:hypothetical protein
MALTEVARLRLEGQEFGALFEGHQHTWTAMAEEARGVMAGQLGGRSPTVDDIAKILQPMLEISDVLRTFLAENKLTQKYWYRDFTDYILHNVYQPTLTIPGA